MQEMENVIRRFDEGKQEQLALRQHMHAVMQERDKIKLQRDEAVRAQSELEQELSKWNGKLVAMCHSNDTNRELHAIRTVAATRQMHPVARNELRRQIRIQVLQELREREQEIDKREEVIIRQTQSLLQNQQNLLQAQEAINTTFAVAKDRAHQQVQEEIVLLQSERAREKEELMTQNSELSSAKLAIEREFQELKKEKALMGTDLDLAKEYIEALKHELEDSHNSLEACRRELANCISLLDKTQEELLRMEEIQQGCHTDFVECKQVRLS